MLMIKEKYNDSRNVERISNIIDWCSKNKLSLLNSLTDEEWEYLRILENYLALANKETLTGTNKIVEMTYVSDGSLRGINVPKNIINRLDSIYETLGPVNDKKEIAIPRVKTSLLTQEEIDAVVVLVKSGKINFNNIHRILTQEEIDSIRDILDEAKMKKKALCR